MKPWTIATTLLLAATGSSAWRDFKTIEFESNDCTGWINHANLGNKAQFWQIRIDNTSNSVYTETVNDGIYRWYAFSELTDAGCEGKVLGRLFPGCISLGVYSERIRCLKWCSTWARDDHSCEAIVQD
ncbi:hypothetical protein GGS26DRAFT_381940 [Hypomontagnella submonticulosa]|nr:hypothetical protein GGS26DRAFT_381940 [Hypomontagnella submonticulosa]